MKKSFLEFFARLQTRDISVCHQIRLRGDDSFSYWLKKKKKKKAQDILCSRMWAWIFREKRCTVGMRSALAQTGLTTNSSGDV